MLRRGCAQPGMCSALGPLRPCLAFGVGLCAPACTSPPGSPVLRLFCTRGQLTHTFFLPNLLSSATHHLKRCLSVVVTLQDAGIVRANGHCTQARETPLRATLQDAHHERCKHVPTPSAGYTALVDMIMGLSGSFFRDMLSPKVSIGVGAALWQQLADRPLLRRWRRIVLRESAGGGVSGTPTAGAVSGELPLHAFGPRPLHASPSRMTPSFDPWAACASHPPTTVSSIPASADP